MSIRDRLLGPTASWNHETDEVTLVPHVFLTRVLLFDSYVLESHGLKELPGLVGLLGYDGLMELLKTGVLRFHAFRLFAGNIEGETYSLAFDGSVQPARPGFYKLTNVRIDTPKNAYHEYFNVVRSIPDLTEKKRIRLKSEVASRLIQIPEGFGDASTMQTHIELDRDLSGLRRAASQLLGRRLGGSVPPEAIRLTVHREGEIDVFFETNLEGDFGLGPQESHDVLGNALLALDRVNVRIELMKVCSAVSGLQEAEYDFLWDKFEFLMREVRPEAQEERLQRVVEVNGLPDLAEGFASGRLNVDKFLEIRKSQECIEFKTWLRSLDDLTDDEVRDRVASLSARLGNMAHSALGKALRVATTTGVGAIPGLGLLLGGAASVLDAFLVDKLLREVGPVAFLTRLYPSMFDK
jgi:hypothetical protein